MQSKEFNSLSCVDLFLDSSVIATGSVAIVWIIACWQFIPISMDNFGNTKQTIKWSHFAVKLCLIHVHLVIHERMFLTESYLLGSLLVDYWEETRALSYSICQTIASLATDIQIHNIALKKSILDESQSRWAVLQVKLLARCTWHVLQIAVNINKCSMWKWLQI